MRLLIQTGLILLCLYCTPPVVAAPSPPLNPAPEQDQLTLQHITDGVYVPWGMVWLNEETLLVTDREGQLRVMRNGQLHPAPIDGLPKVNARNQGGLLDVKADPDYAKNGWIYLSYAGFEGKASGSHTSILRGKLNGNHLTEQQLLFHGAPNTSKNHHYGSRIVFDKQGYLYFSVGDRGARETDPQRLDRDAGKIHRILPDGTLPPNNPFVEQEGANHSVYTLGHRNPQGMAVHPQTGEIWTHEHGPRGGDEINILQAGANYGWPVITYGINYSGSKITDLTHKEGMQQPIWQWTPSIAPSGMLFVTGKQYGSLQGHLLVGSLRFQHLVLVKLDGNKVTSHSKLFEGLGRVRSLAQHPNGDIYIGVEGKGIYKLVRHKKATE